MNNNKIKQPEIKKHVPKKIIIDKREGETCTRVLPLPCSQAHNILHFPFS